MSKNQIGRGTTCLCRVFLLIGAAALLLQPASVRAWDVFYDASLPPTNAALFPDMWRVLPSSYPEGPNYSVAGGVLFVGTRLPGQGDTLFSPFRSVDAEGPLTVEARVKVGEVHAASGPLSTYGIKLQAAWGPGLVGLFAGEIRVRTGDLDYISHAVEMTEFRTVRIAVNGPDDRRVSIALDGVEIYSSPLLDTIENQLVFGNRGYGSSYGYGDSYWDYVAYSNAYIPVPEPSSLLALSAGLAGMAGAMRRRLR